MDVPVRVLALVWMIGEVGAKEHPPNSNTGVRVSFYQAACALARTIPTGWAWCKAVVQCAFREVGHPLAYTTASCGEFRRWARGLGWERPAAAAGWPGDVVEFDWDKLDGPGQGDWPDHTGMVVSRRGHRPPRIVLDALQKKLGLASTSAVLTWLETMHRSWEYVCVEGNTAVGNDSNGGQVMLRGRELRQIQAFITVPGVATIEAGRRAACAAVRRRRRHRQEREGRRPRLALDPREAVGQAAPSQPEADRHPPQRGRQEVIARRRILQRALRTLAAHLVALRIAAAASPNARERRRQPLGRRDHRRRHSGARRRR
ncbi:MAG: hypothetical protein R3C15_15400 [Thermoleophilia bacterium]